MKLGGWRTVLLLILCVAGLVNQQFLLSANTIAGPFTHDRMINLMGIGATLMLPGIIRRLWRFEPGGYVQVSFYLLLVGIIVPQAFLLTHFRKGFLEIGITHPELMGKLEGIFDLPMPTNKEAYWLGALTLTLALKFASEFLKARRAGLIAPTDPQKRDQVEQCAIALNLSTYSIAVLALAFGVHL